MTDESKRPRESGLDPYRLARRFAGKLQVRFWRDEFWVWQPTLYRYRRVTERDLRARVAALLKQEIDAKSLTQGGYAAHVTVARVNNILAALKQTSRRERTLRVFGNPHLQPRSGDNARECGIARRPVAF